MSAFSHSSIPEIYTLGVQCTLKGAARGTEGAQPPLSNQNIDVSFLSFFTNFVSRNRGIAECYSAEPQGITTHLLSNQTVMNFRGLRNIEAVFFIPSWFVLPSITGVPNLGYMYPWGYICLSKGVHLWLAIEGKNIFACFLFSNLYTYIT